MNEVQKAFLVSPGLVVAQLLSIVHLVTASIATMVALRKTKELSLSLLLALLAFWLIPLLGAACFLWKLRASRRHAHA